MQSTLIHFQRRTSKIIDVFVFPWYTNLHTRHHHLTKVLLVMLSRPTDIHKSKGTINKDSRDIITLPRVHETLKGDLLLRYREYQAFSDTTILRLDEKFSSYRGQKSGQNPPVWKLSAQSYKQGEDEGAKGGRIESGQECIVKGERE